MAMTWVPVAAAQQAGDGGFNVGTLLLFVGGAIVLAFFSSIGVIARMRENRLEARRQARQSQPTVSPAGDPPRDAAGDLPDPQPPN